MSLLLSEGGCRLLYLKPTEEKKSCELSLVADGHNPAGEQSKPCSQPLAGLLKGGHWLKPMYHSVNVSQ